MSSYPTKSIREVSAELVRALGIDTKTTGACTIRIKPGEFPVIEIEKLITEANANDLVTVLQKCKLVPIDHVTEDLAAMLRRFGLKLVPDTEEPNDGQ